MNHKHFSGLFSIMCGINGYGIITLNIHMQSDVVKFILAMITAVIAGAAGYAGQLLMKWIIRKVNKKHK